MFWAKCVVITKPTPQHSNTIPAVGRFVCLVFGQVMETLEHALKRGARIHAEYLGGAVTCDAHHMTEPRKDGAGVGRCIDLALKESGLTYKDVSVPCCQTTVGRLVCMLLSTRCIPDQTDVGDLMVDEY